MHAVGCVERLLTEIAERTLFGVLITWVAMVIAADLDIPTKLAIAWLVLAGQVIIGVLGSFIGNRCSASLLPDSEH
jgi:flagellar biosynthesis protein FliR